MGGGGSGGWGEKLGFEQNGPSVSKEGFVTASTGTWRFDLIAFRVKLLLDAGHGKLLHTLLFSFLKAGRKKERESKREKENTKTFIFFLSACIDAAEPIAVGIVTELLFCHSSGISLLEE